MPAASKMLERKRKREEEERKGKEESESESSSSEEESGNGNASKKKKDEGVKGASSSDDDSSDDSSSDDDSDSDSSSEDESVKKEGAKKKTQVAEKKEEEKKKAPVQVQKKVEDNGKKKVEESGKKKVEENGKGKKAETPSKENAKKAVTNNTHADTPKKKEEKKENKQKKEEDPKVVAWRQANNLSIQGDDCPAPYVSFSEATFPSYISQAIKTLKFEKPTPIQSQAWPLALAGRDMIGLAETGSGKTLAFMIPGVVHTHNKPQAERAKGPSVLVLAPTRELAQQIEAVTATTCGAAKIKSCCVYGGAPKSVQAGKLKGAEVIIATPGRLIDFMNEKTVDLSNVTYLVLDEADRMLDMGFELQINEIMRTIVSPDRQTLMFSATWPGDVQRLSQKFFTDPIKITIGSETLKGATKVTQVVEVCTERERIQKLKQLLNKLFKDNCRILVFMLYKRSCSQLGEELEREGWPVGCINGDMSQNARDNTLAQFKSGTKPIMVATDVAARGLDIKEVKYVINVEFPLKCEDYVHRIGRTGRAGEAGTAYTFFTESDKNHARELLQILKESGQNADEKFLALANNAPGIKPKKTLMEEMYGDYAKGRNMADMAKGPTRIVFD